MPAAPTRGPESPARRWGRLPLGVSPCWSVFLVLLASGAWAAEPSDPATLLQKARENAQKAEGGQSPESQLLRELNAALFEAEQALGSGQAPRAVQRAERALAGIPFVTEPARAAQMKTRAAAIVAAARKAEQDTAGAKQQADLAAARQRGAAAAAADLRALADRGWKLFERGENDKALALADEMLKLQPGSREAIFLRQEALRGSEPPADDLKALRAARKRAEDRTLIQQINDEIAVPKQIISKVVVPGKEEPGPRPQRPEKALESWEQRLRAKLGESLTAEFRDATLGEACRYLAELTDTTILMDPAVARSVERFGLPRMTLSFEHWLRWVCRLWQVNYVLRDHAILITSRGGILDQPVTRDYDVAGLLVPTRVSRTVLNTEVQPDDTSGGGRAQLAPLVASDPVEEPISKNALGDAWVQFIRSTVAPASWDEPAQGGVLQEKQQYNIAYRNGRIVVVHTPEVQEQVQRLLDNFRKARTLQVHVLARFIQLRMDYLQQIDIDLGDAQRLGFDSRPGASPSKTTSIFGSVLNDDQVPLVKGGVDASGGLTLRYSYLNDGALNALLHAVLKRRKGTLLIAPRLTCFNTQRANFQSITNFNYVRSITADNEPEIGNVPDGIVFDIQPFVSGDRRSITLVLQPQLRTLRSMTTFQFIRPLPGTIGPERFVQVPEVELRSIATTVTVPDGGSLIVGGLAEATENRGVATVPFVNGVPVLRYLFRGWTEAEGRTSLVVVVTATIVPDIFEE